MYDNIHGFGGVCIHYIYDPKCWYISEYVYANIWLPSIKYLFLHSVFRGSVLEQQTCRLHKAEGTARLIPWLKSWWFSYLGIIKSQETPCLFSSSSFCQSIFKHPLDVTRYLLLLWLTMTSWAVNSVTLSNFVAKTSFFPPFFFTPPTLAHRSIRANKARGRDH